MKTKIKNSNKNKETNNGDKNSPTIYCAVPDPIIIQQFIGLKMVERKIDIVRTDIRALLLSWGQLRKVPSAPCWRYQVPDTS